MFSEVIELISFNTSIDENGFEISTETKEEVFADKKSVRSTEFYEAQKLGYKLSVMFVIRPYEYNGQEYIYYENNKYKIERTYEKNTEQLEIICSKVI